MKTITKIVVLASLVIAVSLYQASATVVGVDLGTGNPPTTLGGYTVNPFEPGPLVGENYSAHLTNGNDDGTGGGPWATWGQSYTGFVHVFLTSLSISFSLSGVQAVYFYEEPNQFSDFLMTATDSSGTSVSTIINGDHGSSAVGFFETVPGTFLTSISVSASDPTGFAIGEFGLDDGSLTGGLPTPDTGSSLVLMLIALGAILILSPVASLARTCC